MSGATGCAKPSSRSPCGWGWTISGDVTKGQSAILLMSTVPALTNWESEIKEMAEAVREVAREKNTAFADIEEAFRRAGQEEEARKALFAWDEVHLGEFGHQVVAEAVFEAVVGEVPEMQA